MRSFASRSRNPIPALIPALALAVLVSATLSACSRTDDKSAMPAGATTAQQEVAPVAGGPSTLKPGRWKTVTQTPMGPEDSIQCVGEGYDPGAELAQKSSPCGKPTVTRTADGFSLEHACEKDHIRYALTGAVRGDFTTNATADLDLTLSAFGRKQALHVRAVSTYLGPCDPDAPKPAS